ncbi:MAG: endonuclease NucS [Solirubrobacteraceae bacterium MAG38_C4-C5]|nr:endonuclease NucS [Candidatus Siliceabacter maunaloa]
MDDAVREQIRELLKTGLPTEEVAGHLGVPKGTVSAVKAHLTRVAIPHDASSLTEADVEEITDAATLRFGFERQMQDELRRNIHQLDPGLRIVDEGRERRVESGFIDILAEDDQGSLVVIELKISEAPDSAIAQVLSYIGSLQTEEDPRAVRGILIARDFTTRVRLAARAAAIQLVEYGFNFSFAAVGADSDRVRPTAVDG